MGKKMRVEKNIRENTFQSGKKPSKDKPKPKPQASKPQQQPSSSSADTNAPPPLPLPVQQRLLSSFNAAFKPVLTSDTFPALLQEVKAALYARDFNAAFTSARPEALDAYAARWSPTRALGYAAVLLGIGEHLAADVHRDVVPGAGDLADKPAGPSGGDGASGDDNQDAPRGKDVASPSAADEASTTGAQKSIKMLSIGGGAAEIGAFAAYISQQEDPSLTGTIASLDSAPWNKAVSELHGALTVPPPLPQYANAAARASNAAVVQPERLSSTFTQQDVILMTQQQLSQSLGDEPLLVTLLFTLNELYTTAGIGKTTSFLLNLTATIPHGSLLLVVDSPGSYSEAAVGKESKKYPMQWLMDHTLLKKTEKDAVEGCRWEKLESHDSIWFRLADSLKYPISLENMRYQMHLYRATKP